jgi:RND family efflux transporter MFP subunit
MNMIRQDGKRPILPGLSVMPVSGSAFLQGGLLAALLSLPGCSDGVSQEPLSPVANETIVAALVNEPMSAAAISAESVSPLDVNRINIETPPAHDRIDDASQPVLHTDIVSSENRQALDCLIEPHEISEVATSIPGVLEEVMVGRGSRVTKDQIVAKLRSSVEKANVDLARATVKFRERNYRRLREMQEKNYTSSVEMDEAQNRLEIAQFELERAEQILNERIIRSPFDGVVVEQYLSAGELSEDRKIFKLAKINVLNVEVIAPAHLLGMVRKGMQAKVYPEGPVPGPFLAPVTVVDPIIDAASGTLGIRLELPNPDYSIPAGVKCRIDFQDTDLKQ